MLGAVKNVRACHSSPVSSLSWRLMFIVSTLSPAWRRSTWNGATKRAAFSPGVLCVIGRPFAFLFSGAVEQCFGRKAGILALAERKDG